MINDFIELFNRFEQLIANIELAVNTINSRIAVYELIGKVYLAVFIILIFLVIGCYVAIARIEKRVDCIYWKLYDKKPD